MRQLYKLRLRLRSLFRRRAVEQELDRELQFHLDQLVEETAAQKVFGNRTQVMEEVREMWGWRSLDRLLLDLRYTARSMPKEPGFFLSAILILALAIGTNTAVFSLIQTVLLNPLPYPDPDRLVMIWQAAPHGAENGVGIAPADIPELQRQFTSASELSTYVGSDRVVSGIAEPFNASTAFISSNFFGLLGVQPTLGRGLTAEDEDLRSTPVAILSHQLWQQRLGADPDIIGSNLTIGGRVHVVVGVMGESFAFPQIYGAGPHFDLWTALPPELLTRIELLARFASGASDMNLFARLKPETRLATAQAQLATIGKQLRAGRPETDADGSLTAVPLQEQVVSSVRPFLVVLWGAVFCILLVACANLANMSLSRALARQKELAMRASLGASRWRLIRQLLTESIALALCGGALGFALAWSLIRLSPALDFAGIPRLAEIHMDPMVLLFSLGLSVLTGLLFGTLPAWRVSGAGPQRQLQESGTVSGGQRTGVLRGVLVVAQVSIALMLLIGAGLLIQSFRVLLDAGPGFEAQNRLTFELALPRAKYRSGQAPAYFDRLGEQLRTLPGVEDVNAISAVPLSGARMSWQYRIEDYPLAVGAEPPTSEFRTVTPGFFRSMGVPIVNGRDFEARDTADAPLAGIVNETFARTNWPGEDPIGKQFQRQFQHQGWQLVTVVGVVGDIHFQRIDDAVLPMLYEPLAQGNQTAMTVVVRTNGDPLSLNTAIRAAVLASEPEALVLNLRPMESLVSSALGPRRSAMTLLGTFAGLALFLAAFGIYSVVSYSVMQRTPEIGMRVALGARPADILSLILKQGLALTLVGAVAGILGARALSNLMAGLVYGIEPTDAATIATVSASLVAVSLLACYVPARRAMRVDPVSALRRE